jgi:hypothetical protein
LKVRLRVVGLRPGVASTVRRGEAVRLLVRVGLVHRRSGVWRRIVAALNVARLVVRRLLLLLLLLLELMCQRQRLLRIACRPSGLLLIRTLKGRCSQGRRRRTGWRRGKRLYRLSETG